VSGVLKVVVADDHPLFRAGVVTVLNDWEDIEVVAEAADGAEVLEAAERHQPDVILMDLRMPVVNGLTATSQITAGQPEIAVLVLTMDEDDDSVFAALRAGASGYLLKESGGVDLHRSIVGVANGEAIFGPGIAQRVKSFFSSARPQVNTPGPFPKLTPREWEVLDLLARGNSNQEIARRMNLSDKTIRNRISDILVKMQARSRAEAVAMARDAGVGGGSD
jgi:DNA-binding NarL/FixJ family response regulator